MLQNRHIFKLRMIRYIMVTKYDVFEIAYNYGGFLNVDKILEKLNKSKDEYHKVYHLLSKLYSDGFVKKDQLGYSIVKNKRSKDLYKIVYYCIRNSINYNLFFDNNFINFVKRGLALGSINQKKMKVNSRTFSKYVEILEKYGLLLIISKKPFSAIIFYNVLINNLLAFFGIQEFNLKNKKVNYFKIIENQRLLFKKLKKKNERGFLSILKEFEVSFIYHSLSLEGNRATLPDTVKIIDEKIVPENLRLEDIDEVRNYNLALSEMFKDVESGVLISTDLILKYHSLAMGHKIEFAGRIRDVGVHIKGNLNFRVGHFSEIKKNLDNLIYEYNNFMLEKKKTVKEIIEFAAFFHNEFQFIHPFVDGNSRTTRLLLFHLLNSLDTPVLDIPLGLLDEYLNSTKGAKKRSDAELSLALQRLVLFNLKKINDRL